MAQRLNMETWVNIFRNLSEMTPDEYYDGVVDWVEVIWLDNVGEPSEWGLAFGEELFEDGFTSEREAQERLNYLERELLQ
jgi:hypothetical protein